MLLDAAIAGTILGAALAAVAIPREDRALVATIVVGAGLALAWLRLGAPIVALVEASVGTVVATMLLRRAFARSDAAARCDVGSLPTSTERVVVPLMALVIAGSLTMVVHAFGRPLPVLAIAATGLVGLGLAGVTLSSDVLRRVIGLRALIAGATLTLGVFVGATDTTSRLDLRTQFMAATATMLAVLVAALAARIVIRIGFHVDDRRTAATARSS